METLDITARRLFHEERTLSLATSARRGPFTIEQRVGLLLIAVGRRLTWGPPAPARTLRELDHVRGG